MISSDQNIYLSRAWDQRFRIFSMINRNPHSSLKGSFSRTHWAWKFNDFPFPRFQEGIYYLVSLYSTEGLPTFKSDRLLGWIEWSFEYWLNLQNRNGSFDEAYPNEQCLAATAFTSFYVSEAFEQIKDDLSVNLQLRIRGALEAAGEWLLNNDETHGILSNHLAVAVVALENIGVLTGRDEFQRRAIFFLERIFTNQSSEGWMREYGGCDIGYGSHCFFYLACYFKKTQCKKTLERLTKFSGFLKYFCHPDGSFGGEYSSRDTEFFYPAGFEIMADLSEDSALIAKWGRKALHKMTVCQNYTMDEFNIFPITNNLLFASQHCSEATVSGELPYQQPPFVKNFAESGIVVVNQFDTYAVIGAKKGGTLGVFDRNGQWSQRHSGLLIERKGCFYTNHRLSNVEYSVDEDSICLNPQWKRVKFPHFKPLLFIAFRLFNLSFGRFPAVSQWLKSILVHVLIKKEEILQVKHKRVISWKDEQFLIEDDLDDLSSGDQLLAGEHFTSVHMGSSLYVDDRHFQKSPRYESLSPIGKAHKIRGRLSQKGQFWTAVAEER